MKAITIIQPWASMIVMGLKSIETRTHEHLKGLRGERIAIHAGNKFDHAAAQSIWQAARSNPGLMRKLAFYDLERHGPWPRGCVLGTALVIDARPLTAEDTERALCAADGLFGLVLTEVERFERPLGARGRQGIWTWEPEAVLQTAR